MIPRHIWYHPQYSQSGLQCRHHFAQNMEADPEGWMVLLDRKYPERYPDNIHIFDDMFIGGWGITPYEGETKTIKSYASPAKYTISPECAFNITGTPYMVVNSWNALLTRIALSAKWIDKLQDPTQEQLLQAFMGTTAQVSHQETFYYIAGYKTIEPALAETLTIGPYLKKYYERFPYKRPGVLYWWNEYRAKIQALEGEQVEIPPLVDFGEGWTVKGYY